MKMGMGMGMGMEMVAVDEMPMVLYNCDTSASMIWCWDGDGIECMKDLAWILIGNKIESMAKHHLHVEAIAMMEMAMAMVSNVCDVWTSYGPNP